MKKFKRRNMYLLILLCGVIIIGSIGATLANITAASGVRGNVVDIVAKIVFEKDASGNDISSLVSNGKLLPIKVDEENIDTILNEEDIVKFKFWVSGIKENPEESIYDISLGKINMSCELKNENVKWLLYKDGKLLNNGSFSPTFDIMKNDRMVLTKTQEDLTTEVSEYLLVIYIEETDNDQSSVLGKHLSANVRVETATGTKKVNVRKKGEELNCTGNNVVVAYPECADDLVYNGTSLNLIKNGVSSGIIVNQNIGLEPSTYTVTAKLSSGYKWPNEETSDYAFNCTINKRTITIKSIDQNNDTFESSPNYVTVDNLVEGHNISSIKLTRISTTDGHDIITPSKAVIKDSEGKDVTNFYNINYQSLGEIK